MAFLSELQSQETLGPNNDVEPDLGAWQGFKGAWNMGTRESLVNVSGNLVYRTYLGNRDKMQGLEALDEESFSEQFGNPKETGFEYKKDETISQAKMRFKDYIEGVAQQKRASNIGIVGGLTAGLLSNSLWDAPLMFIPYAKMANSARVGAKVLQGHKISAAAKLVDSMSTNKLSSKMIQAALAGEKQVLKPGETFYNLTKLGFAEQFVENTAVYFGSQALGRDYGFLDHGMDTALGGSFISILGGFQTRRLMKIGNLMARNITNAKALSLMVSDGDMRGVIRHLQEFTDESTGTFWNSVDRNPRVQAILDMDQAVFNADPTARQELADFLQENVDAVLFNTIKGQVASRFDENLSVVDMRRKQHAQMARITEHLRGEKIDLTPEELEIVAGSKAKIQQLFETVYSAGSTPVAGDPGNAKRSISIDRLERNQRVRRKLEVAKTRQIDKELESLESEAADIKAQLKTLTGSKRKAKQGTLDYLEKKIAQLNKQGNFLDSRKRVPLEQQKQTPTQVDPDIQATRIKADLKEARSLLKESQDSKKILRDLDRESGASARKLQKLQNDAKVKEESIIKKKSELLLEEREAASSVNRAKSRVSSAQSRWNAATKESERLHRKKDNTKLTLDEEAQLRALDEKTQRIENLLKKNKVELEKAKKLLLQKKRATQSKTELEVELERIQSEIQSLKEDLSLAETRQISEARKKAEEEENFWRQMIKTLEEEEADIRNLQARDTLGTSAKTAPFTKAKSVDSSGRGRGREIKGALKPTPRKPMDQAVSELETKLESEAEQARKGEKIREDEAVKSVEETARAAMEHPLVTAQKSIKRLLTGPLAQIALDVKAEPADLAKRLSIILDNFGPKGSKVRDQYEALMSRVMRHKWQTQDKYSHAWAVFTGSDIDVTVAGESGAIRLSQLRNRMDEEGLTFVQAEREFTEWLNLEEQTAILRELKNHWAQRQHDRALAKFKADKSRLKYIKSWMDGLGRKGVRLRRGSIQSDINAQITKDMSKLRRVFVKHGFIDYLDNTVHRVKGESEMDYLARRQARKDASNMFVEDLGEYYRSKDPEIVKKYGDQGKDFEAIAEALEDTLHSQIFQLNEMGAGIVLRQDHLGLSYRWDNRTIRSMGFDSFRARMIEDIDWVATEKAHGGLMVGSKNAFGYADSMVKFDRDEFIKAWYAEATGPVKPMDHHSQDIARSFGKSRMIHVEKGKEFKVLKDFSGHGSLGRLLQDQIRHRSEMIAIMRNLGNNPMANFDAIMRGAGIAREVNTTRVATGSKLDKSLVASGAAGKAHQMDVSHAYNTAEFLTGALDNPASHDLSFWGKSFRQLSHIAFMWTPVVSAITDVPITLMTLQQMGTGVTIPQLAGAMRRSASRRFHGEQSQLTQFYEGSGAAFDALKNAGARRLALAEANGDTFLAKGSEMMFTINGLSFWTSMMQEAFADVLTQSLARQARTGNWDRHMMATMRSFGFTRADFAAIEGGIRDINGVERVGPPSFEGTALEMKLLQFFSEYRDKAVVVPDASTQSLVRFGSQAGTFHGEVIRSVMQYSSFPVAMNRVVNRFLLISSEGISPWTTGQMSIARMAVFVGGMLGLAYAATALKDLSRMRSPAMPWELNGPMTMRIIDQSGIAGTVGMLLGAGLDGRVSGIVAPNVSTMANIAGKLQDEGFGSALYASRAYTGDNIPVFGPLITTGLAYGLQGTYSESLRISANFWEEKLGVERMLPMPKP